MKKLFIVSGTFMFGEEAEPGDTDLAPDMIKQLAKRDLALLRNVAVPALGIKHMQFLVVKQDALTAWSMGDMEFMTPEDMKVGDR